jgi:hypothetical protein
MRFAHLKTHHRFERMRLRGFTGARDDREPFALDQPRIHARPDHRLEQLPKTDSPFALFRA